MSGTIRKETKEGLPTNMREGSCKLAPANYSAESTLLEEGNLAKHMHEGPGQSCRRTWGSWQSPWSACKWTRAASMAQTRSLVRGTVGWLPLALWENAQREALLLRPTRARPLDKNNILSRGSPCNYKPREHTNHI